jgi:hypothetical protein
MKLLSCQALDEILGSNGQEAEHTCRTLAAGKALQASNMAFTVPS